MEGTVPCTFTPPTQRFIYAILRRWIMECLHRLGGTGAIDPPVTNYDGEKLSRIREKIALVFGRASAWDDATLSERYNITADGDLIMIVK